MFDSTLCLSRVDSRLYGTRDLLQGHMPRFRELIRATERPCSIGVPAVRPTTCSGHCESTFVFIRKNCGTLIRMNREEIM